MFGVFVWGGDAEVAADVTMVTMTMMKIEKHRTDVSS